LILSLVLVVGLAPVTVKVSRAGASVAARLTTAALVVGLAVARSGELETTCTASRQGASVTTNGHRLTATMSASANVSSALETETLWSWRGTGTRLVVRSGLVLRSWGGGRELESRGCTLLLGQFGGLFRLGKGKGMATLVTTTARGSTTAATVVGVLILLVIILALLVVIGISGSTRRWSRGRAHRKTRESRLIATVGVLIRCVHGHPKLLLLLGELEGVDLRRNATHGAAWGEGADLAKLLGLQETHVHVLLVCRGNLLLLLLKQLNLLLNSQLFH
jgi:hypothetical protein